MADTSRMYLDYIYDWMCDKGAPDAADMVRALLTERDAAQAEVARLTAALAEAETRGAERMRARASNVAWACWADKEAEASRDHIANAIRALPLPPRERDGQEGE